MNSKPIEYEGRKLFVVSELYKFDCYGCCFCRISHKPGDGGTAECRHAGTFQCASQATIFVEDLEQYTVAKVTAKLTS